VPVRERNLPQNVCRLAGMHLASIERLAEYCQSPARRSVRRHARPDDTVAPEGQNRAEKIAEAFGVTLNALYQEPDVCPREAVDHFHDAPMASFMEPPPVELSATERRKLGMKSWLELRTRRYDGSV
jgi:hypothetical protein